jgi:DNA-binding FrmR family transcriptional regulator
MVDEDKYCIEILDQVAAATKALQAVALHLLDDHLKHCLTDEARIDEASAAIARLVRS